MSALSIIKQKSDDINAITAQFLQRARAEYNDVDSPASKAFYDQIREYTLTNDTQLMLLDYCIGVIAHIETNIDVTNIKPDVCFLAAVFDTDYHTAMIDELTRRKSQSKESIYFSIIVATDLVIKLYNKIVHKMHIGEVVEDEKYESDMDCIIADNDKRYALINHAYYSFMSWHTGYEKMSIIMISYLMDQGYGGADSKSEQ